MKTFTIEVDGIRRREYYEACRENGRRLHIILAGSMIVICGAILILKSSIRPADILGPAAIYAVVTAGYVLLTRLGYKDQLAVLDPPVVYSFNGGRWTADNGSVTAEIEWKATPRMRKTRSCLFLYNDGASGNLIPLRLLTDEQLAAIETWYRNSREQAKVWQKEQEKQERQKFRDTHPQLRFGRTGPAWGPWKRRK